MSTEAEAWQARRKAWRSSIALNRAARGRRAAKKKRAAQRKHPSAIRLIVNTDGASRGNPGPAGIGVLVADKDGQVVEELAEGIDYATSNQAEYRAALAGLWLAAKLAARAVTLRSDSRLLVEQLAGRYEVKNPILQRLHEKVCRLMAIFDEVTVEHVPREENAHADRLANRGIDEWLVGQLDPSLDPAVYPQSKFDADHRAGMEDV